MIKVRQLTKRYGGFTAVDRVSFTVEKGEVVGFLGPNGAGKSTTMRMLSCYLPATSGRAEIAGFDVFTDSIRAREHIGYMPENVPLPQDMRVDEYLAFRARIKGVLGRRIHERVDDVCALCGLENGMERRMIGTLSKGYRQRVGLADAIVHEPDLLILDEPTIGLDPNQIRQVRALIRNLSRHHTILISTHILPEVEMTCSRVIIIAGGKIQAQDTPDNLRRRLGTGSISLEAWVRSPEEVAEKLETFKFIDAVEHATHEGWTTFSIATKKDLRADIFDLAKREDWRVRELSLNTVSLEEVFAEITEDSV